MHLGPIELDNVLLFQVYQLCPLARHICCLLGLNLCFSYNGLEMLICVCNLMKYLSYRGDILMIELEKKMKENNMCFILWS